MSAAVSSAAGAVASASGGAAGSDGDGIALAVRCSAAGWPGSASSHSPKVGQSASVSLCQARANSLATASPQCRCSAAKSAW
jgi:hypothetical protein